MINALKTVISLNPAKNLQGYAETCVHLLKNLTKRGLVTEGSVLHGHLIKMGLSSERYMATKLLMMYLDSRKSAEANEIIKDFNGFDLVAHNCLMNAYVRWGDFDIARKLFDEMPERNDVTWTTMISGFMKYGRVKESMWYFERDPFQNVFTWTAMISGYVQNGFCFEGLKLFLKLLESGVRPNEVTFTSVVKACAELRELTLGMSVLGWIVKSGFEDNVLVSNSFITLFVRMGETDMSRMLFDRMEKRDIVSWTAILDMYAQMGDLEQARRIFSEMPERNEVSWSAMIARCSQSGCIEESLKLFREMTGDGFKPNISCISSVLSTLASVKALKVGMGIHGHAIKLGSEKNAYVSCSLIDLYNKCGKCKDGRLVFDSIKEKNAALWNAMIGGYGLNGELEEAKKLFDIMPSPDNASWNSMITGYSDCKQFDKVFEVFNRMLLSGVIPDQSTFSSLLSACASIASLGKGKDIHGKIVKLGIHYDVFVGTALIDMYAKSGDIDSSRQVFNRMPEKNQFSWTVMIQALAETGFAEECLNLFREMERNSVPPDELTLLPVLFACSHCGLVDEGLRYFNSMKTIYGVKPKGRHYTCVVDMLSRAGRLSEAEEFINSMPFQPETNAWVALLSGCNTYKHEELAKRTARKLREMVEKNSAGYVLLSNIYASAGRWIDVLNIRKLMKEKGLKKLTGYSWIEVRSEVHSFYSDGTHDQSDEIHWILELLRSEIRLLL